MQFADTKESSNQSEEKEKGSDDKEGAKGDGKESENKVRTYVRTCMTYITSLPVCLFLFLTSTLLAKNGLSCLRRCSAVQCSAVVTSFYFCLSDHLSLLQWSDRLIDICFRHLHRHHHLDKCNSLFDAHSAVFTQINAMH